MTTSGAPFTRSNGLAYRTTLSDKVRVWCHVCWGIKAPLGLRVLVPDIDSAYAWWNQHVKTERHAERTATRDAIERIADGLK